MDIQVYELSCVMRIDRNRSLLLVSCFIFKKSLVSCRVNLSLKMLSVLQIFLLELTSRILWSYLGKVYSDIYFYCQMESLLAAHYSGPLT